ncbi:hypothetical protein GCM10023325_19130 [Sphingomonas lutea]
MTSVLSRFAAQAGRLSPSHRHKQQIAAQFAAYAWRLKESEHGVVVRAQERAGGREADCARVAAE